MARFTRPNESSGLTWPDYWRDVVSVRSRWLPV